MTSREDIRTKAIAYEAFKQHLLPEELGNFTDAQWQKLCFDAEVPDCTPMDCAVAVDFLRTLYNHT